jgi:peroxiredoxin
MTTASTSISDQLDELKAASAKALPPDVLVTFATSQRELNAAGVPAGVARAGTPLGDVPLIDAHGSSTSLHAVTDRRPAVIVFYRGAWCPYCNLALRAYRDQLLPQLSDRGVGLVAISPQKPDGSLSMQEKNELAFAVLSDPGNILASRLGILAPPRSADVRAAQERLGLELTAVNADGTDALPMPTIVVVDAENTIRWIDVHPDYTTRTEVPDILAALDLVP